MTRTENALPARLTTGASRILFLVWGIAMIALPHSAAAQNIRLNADRPDVYVVQRGDTLWDIAGQFLEQPWQWPQVWQANPEIEDPDLIYPGDRLRLVMRDGAPRIVRADGSGGERPVTRLRPQVRSTAREEAVQALPREVIDNFMVDNLVIDPDAYEQSPYIVGSTADNLVISTGDTVLVRGRDAGWQDRRRQFDVVRLGQEYDDPGTGRPLGHMALRIGQARLLPGEASADGLRRVEITASRREIQPGDRLMVREGSAVTTEYLPRPASPDVRGHVVALMEGASLAAQYDSLLLTPGRHENLREGDLLTVFSADRPVRDPLTGETLVAAGEPVGRVLVYRVFEQLSFGLVLDGTAPVAPGYRVRAPEQ